MSIVEYDVKDHIALTTPSRPEMRDVINPEMAVRVVDIWKAVRDDDDDRVAIVTRTSSTFCSGADLGENGFSIAYTYLKASWETEGGKLDLHRRYLALTISKFDGFLTTAKQATKRWWTAQLLAGNLERRLGRFEAADKRLANLPLSSQPSGSIYRRVATQVRAAIAARDSAPRKFKPAKE